jgi:TRAP-type C4-dicarboxylate transport system substrate-binding protein
MEETMTMNRRDVRGPTFTVACAAIGLAVLAPADARAAVDGPKVNWTLASFGTARAGTACMDKLAEFLAAETNGNFTLRGAYNETLAPAKEIFDGLKIGAFEAGYMAPPFAPGKQPAAMIFSLPFLPFRDLAEANRISDIYHRHPAVKRDFDAWEAVYMMPVITTSYEIIGKGPAPASLADWRGKRVRALSGYGQALAKLGAVPTTVTSPEIYGALDRGIIDAAALPFYAAVSYRLQEVGKWFTTGMSLGVNIASVALNGPAYGKLPPQYKKLLADLTPRLLDEQVKALEGEDERSIAALKARGLAEIKIPPAMQREFVQLGGQPVWDEWVKEISAKGYPGQELLDIILNETKKARS